MVLHSLCIVLLALALIPAGVTATALTTTQTGTVSGDLYVGAYQPVAWSSQSQTPGVKEFTQAYSIPSFTNVQWARLETVVYAAGTDARHGQTTVKFDAAGDGTYETTLGTEDQQTASSGDATIYPVNDHMDRVYSDYRLWYDVTSLVTSQTPVVYVRTEPLDSSNFDGRVKEITLIVAYNDGDSDQVRYWVNTGHDYQAAGASGVTTTFDTSSVTAGFTAATLKNVALASKDATYTFNALTPAGADPVSPVNYFEANTWDVASGITAGSSSSFGYTNNGGSFKTTIATLTVRGATVQPDLEVTAISPNVGAGAVFFANEPNVISVTVKNNGAGSAGASTLNVNVGGTAYTASVGTLASGASETVTVTDTVSHAGGSSVTITATADSAGILAESDETDNVKSSDLTVYNNGYKGKRWTDATGTDDDMKTQATFEGRYSVIYSAGNSAYSAEGTGTRTASWTSTDLSVPAGATVTSARLYQGSTWSSTGVVPTLTMSFNGNPVSPVTTYTDQKGYGTYNFPGALYVYDVTSSFNTAGNSISFTPDVSTAFYGAYLVVVYQDPATTEKKIWINDEFDMLYSGATRSVTNEEATTYAPFADVDTTGVASAQAIAILSSADGSGGTSLFSFNSQSYTPFTPDYLSGPQVGFSVYDVTSALQSGANEARLQSIISSTSGDNMVAQNVILVVEKATNAPVAAFSATPVIGSAPLSVTFTDASTNSPTAWNWEYRASGTSDSWTSFAITQNPAYSFSAGAYDIRLTATNAGGSNAVTKTQYLSVSSGAKPLATITSGTVSGDLYVGAFQPTPWTNQPSTPGVKTFTQAYTIPAHTDVQWARLYAVVYAAGTDNRAGQATVSFDGNGDGTYETGLGTEQLATASTNTAEVYPVSDNVNKQYSDYMIWYDVTPYISANTVNAQIVTENIGGSTFDGRLKELALVIAYNDGDSDQVKYWVNEGHDYQSSSGSAVTTTFGTSTLSPGWSEATLTNVHHSSKDAAYTFNTAAETGANPVSPYSGFVKNVWDVRTAVTAGSDSSLTYTHASASSYKTTLATLKVRYATPPTAQFTATPTTVTAGSPVQFNSTSLLATTWAWDFNNDGTVDSTEQNPLYTYSATGQYSVKLTVTGEGGSDDEIKTNYITVVNNPTISVSPASQSFLPATTREYQIVMNAAPQGLAGYDMKVMLSNADYAEITKVVYPVWAGSTITPATPGDSITIGAVDLNNLVNTSTSTTNILLATITVRGDNLGTTSITVSDLTLDADGGAAITPDAVTGGEAIITYTGPVAQFTTDKTSGLPPLNVAFTDSSTGTINQWTWDFDNDGTIDSTSQNPSHTYTVPGSYTVKLTVAGPGGSDSVVKTNLITVTSNAPVASFTTDQSSGNKPLPVVFTDTSTGTITSYAWDFDNDGVTDSVLKNPSHTYTIAGTYTAKLTVTGPGGSDTEITTITVNTNGPAAKFGAYPTEGIAPLKVQFSDQSTGEISSWAWDFNNDGTADSTVQNPPVYEYTTAGTYTVKLTVTGPGGSTTATKNNYITASGLTADFTADKTSGTASRNVSFAVAFSDASTGYPSAATSWQWNLGNGATSTDQNPVASYTGRPRQFTVTLNAANAVDDASKTRTNYISITPYLEAFPTYSNKPTDMDADYVYEDINGNGRLDYDDVVAAFTYMDWIDTNNNVDKENYDYNFNSGIDYDDFIVLYEKIIYS